METTNKSAELVAVPKAANSALSALPKPRKITEIDESVIEIVDSGVSRLWLLCNEEPAVDELKDIWVQALAEIEPEYLRALFFRLEKTFLPTSACAFPMPAHILNFVAEDLRFATAQEAEQEWQNALKEIVARFVPSIGWRGEQKPAGFFTARTYAALKVAGGINAIYNASADRLVWAKKEFIEAYKHGQ